VSPRSRPPSRPSAGPLIGGARRRGRLLAFVAILLAPIVVAAAAYLALVREPGGRADAQAAAAAVSPEAALAPGGSLEPRSPAPIRLTGVDAFRPDWRQPPRAALVFDLGDGDVLYRLGPRRTLPMASLTKIMTALAVTQSSRPDEPVRIGRAALEYSGSGVGVLPRGKRVRLETLLNGLMLVSGNDAAIALAEHVSGSERRFVALLNEKARLWGLRCTRFADAHGLGAANRS
jgi:D-alanyl-D-alanine carboxypeptidase (penicillin-binding protein 5/6)